MCLIFEIPKFSEGTYSIAHTLAEVTSKGGITIIGGGDSVAAINKAGLATQMSHISTGGGASLEMLEGKILPGLNKSPGYFISSPQFTNTYGASSATRIS